MVVRGETIFEVLWPLSTLCRFWAQCGELQRLYESVRKYLQRLPLVGVRQQKRCFVLKTLHFHWLNVGMRNLRLRQSLSERLVA